MRTAEAYLNYIRHQVYINAVTDIDKTNYADHTYDLTTDIQAVKNYIGIDSTLQRNAFESYPDLSNYYLTIDDSWFTKDHTTIEVIDIYFSDPTDSTRFDTSVLLFTRDELISGYTKQDASTILHFKFKIHKYPDVTDFLVYSFPIFISPNMGWIANDLIIQYDINFVTINFFTEHSLLMALKEYIQSKYVTYLSPKFMLNFLGQNNINIIDYRELLNGIIFDNLSKSMGKEWMDIRDDMAKYYIHDCTTVVRLAKKTDGDKIIDLFMTTILDFYTNHVDWKIDTTAGFTTDTDLYSVAITKQRLVSESTQLYDKLNVNFLRFVLVRNNIYSQKFTILHDGTEFQEDFIKFRVKNIIPNWQYDFTFVQNGFDIDLTSNHTSDIPLKIDILEYSNNLVWAGSVPYSRFVNEYYFNGFSLKFKANKLTVDYGVNSLRLFLSDTLSEEYKDIRYTFVYAPWEVISTKIAKVKFDAQYHMMKNTWNLEKLMPLSENYTSYADLSARYFDTDNTRDWMWIQLPISYELVYCKDVPIKITLDTTDSTGGLLNHFKYLIQDTTEMRLTIPPTLDLSNSQFGKSFMIMFRYKFDKDVIYTDEIIQKLNGVVHASIENDSTLDSTDTNYFKEWVEFQFITTRFMIRPKSDTPISTVVYQEKEKVAFTPPFSSAKIFRARTAHELKMDSTAQLSGGCNFNIGVASELLNMVKNVKINKTNTVKGLPVTIKLASGISYGTSEGTLSLPTDGTSMLTQNSATVGGVKQMDNFARDQILVTILHAQFTWTTNDLFNWYMSHVQNDIKITYKTDFDLCTIRVGDMAPQMNDLLKCDATYHSWSMLKYLFNWYEWDHTSANPYKDADIEKIKNIVRCDSYYGITTYYIYNMINTFALSMDVKFERSEIYKLSTFNWFISEAFIKKLRPELMPKSQKFTKYGELGELDATGFYNYGDNFRQGVFGGNTNIIDISSDVYKYAESIGLTSGIEPIANYFCENITIDFTTRSGQLLQLTPREVIELYFTDVHDASEAIKQLKTGLAIQLMAPFTHEVKVKRTYSADITATLDALTDDIFSIYIEPTQLSPLYSNFRITDIKFVYDHNTVTLTELFDRQYFTTTRFNINSIIGTGLKFQVKYLNRSISEVPMAVMIYYVDEFGYEKTTSVELTLKSKLQSFVQSQASMVMKWGVNILKALWLLQVFDGQTQCITDAETALDQAVGAVMAGDDYGATSGAKEFWGALFASKDLFFNTYKKYLPEEVLNGFYYNYLEHRVYGRPHFNWDCGVSLFVLPENVELLEDQDPIRMQAEDAGRYLTDATYKAFEGWKFHADKWGDKINPFIDYKRVIEFFYDKYITRRGYDVNLILLPDTTYNISMKTFLVFDQNLNASEKAMPTLSGFLSDIGGGSEGECMVNLQEFLTLARIFPNYEDLLRGVSRNLHIPNNIESYGRVPSAMNPITIQEYYPNQWQVDYNTFINSATMWYVELEKSSKAHFGFCIPFEKIILSVDTTSTGLFDVNFLHTPLANFNTGFGYLDEMCTTNIKVNKWNEKIKVNVQVPSVIPRKYIDVIVRSLF